MAVQNQCFCLVFNLFAVWMLALGVTDSCAQDTLYRADGRIQVVNLEEVNFRQVKYRKQQSLNITLNTTIATFSFIIIRIAIDVLSYANY